MSQIRKTSSTAAAHGVVYDLDARRRERAEAAEAAGPADSAGVSKGARARAAARRAVEAAPEVRAERVAELKARIASGQYSPDAGEVAKELLERGF